MGTRLGTNWHVDLKDKIVTLRKRLGLTQDQVADRSNGLLRRQGVLKLEKGRHLAGSVKFRRGLALGFGATIEEINALVDGDLPPEDLAEKIKERGTKHGSNGSSETVEVTLPNILGVAPGARKLNQLPQWSRLLKYAKVIAPDIEDDVWDEVGEGHQTFAKPPKAKLLVTLARYIIEDRELSESSEPRPALKKPSK